MTLLPFSSVLLAGDRRFIALLGYGAIERRPDGWRFGTRRIADQVVARLINSGRAVRDGNRVRLASPLSAQTRSPSMPTSELERLSRELAARGSLVEAGWIGLRIAALPVDVPADQLTELRNTFFAGAHHLFASLMTILDPVDGVEPTVEELDRITLINAELKEFITIYAATRLPTKGTA